MHPRVLRGAAPAIPWITAAIAVGAVGIATVLNVQDRGGSTPPSSTFAAVGIVMSVVALVTVLGATRRTGVPWRAAIAFAGGFAAIMLAKFAFGPTALFQGNATTVIQNQAGASPGGLVVDIGIVVGLLYVLAVWALVVFFRPAPPPDGPRWGPVLALGALSLGAIFLSGVLETAGVQYIGWALTGLEATAIGLALFVASGLVGLAFHDTAARSRAVGTTSMYLTVAWIVVAFLLVFQILWIVFLLAVVSIWPLRSVTPK